MPRYVVERDFPEALAIPINADGRKALDGVIAANADLGVTWVHSYVSQDKRQTFCIYDAPTPEAIRTVAGKKRPAGGPYHASQRARPLQLRRLRGTPWAWMRTCRSASSRSLATFPSVKTTFAAV